MCRDASELRLKLLKWTCGPGMDVQPGGGRAAGEALALCWQAGARVGTGVCLCAGPGHAALRGQSGSVRRPRIQLCHLASARLQ